MTQVFYPGTRAYRQVVYKIRQRQHGLCYGCRKLFAGIDLIVRGSGKKPRYYHLRCAERFKITDELELSALSKIIGTGGRTIARTVRRSVKNEYERMRVLRHMGHA